MLYLGGDGAETVRGREWPGDVGLMEQVPILSFKVSPSSPSCSGLCKWRWELHHPHTAASCEEHTLGLPCAPHIKNNPVYCLESQQELNCLQLNTSQKSQNVEGFQKKEVPTGVPRAAQEQTARWKLHLKLRHSGVTIL